MCRNLCYAAIGRVLSWAAHDMIVDVQVEAQWEQRAGRGSEQPQEGLPDGKDGAVTGSEASGRGQGEAEKHAGSTSEGAESRRHDASEL